LSEFWRLGRRREYKFKLIRGRGGPAMPFGGIIHRFGSDSPVNLRWIIHRVKLSEFDRLRAESRALH
jgi:hypothetical protein